MLAAAVAVELATRGLTVHLSTTDPAAHVADTIAGEVPGLKEKDLLTDERYRELMRDYPHQFVAGIQF